MIDTDNISTLNKLLYILTAVALVVIALDINIWRP